MKCSSKHKEKKELLTKISYYSEICENRTLNKQDSYINRINNKVQM